MDNDKAPPAPPWFMPGEKRVYLTAWRDGFHGRDMRRSKWPNAYGRGYNEGYSVRLARAREEG